ncbi:MAG: methyltransferase domain-containing protein [Acidobacteria bacterium]|nr:methyltransferase domain-containing protein [Acidobacteriota bacterium]
MSLLKLRRLGGPRELEVSMAGVKLGSRVLQMGGDGGLIAALASVVGLSGQASAAVQEAGQVAAFERAAAKAGVLVEVKATSFASLPYEEASFDVVVIKNVLGGLRQNERVFSLQEAGRVLRKGGRCLVIEQSVRGGLGALFSRQQLDRQYAAGGARAALAAEGFAGVRLLADRDGYRFTEGTRA